MAAALALALIIAPSLAFEAGETVTVQTSSYIHAGNQAIHVTGAVSPAPTSANMAIVVTTKGPAGVVDVGTADVEPGTGSYSYTLISGGALWVSGTYSVKATYGGPSGTGSAVTNFSFVPAAAARQ